MELVPNGDTTIKRRIVILFALSVIMLCATTPSASAQETQHEQVSDGSPISEGRATRDSDLPNTPSAQINQDKEPPPPLRMGQPGQNHVGTPMNPDPLLLPILFAGTPPLSEGSKFHIYVHRTYSPAAVIFPLFGTGIRMANPKDEYPREWRDGLGAFGRLYGDTMAQRTARSTADFATQMMLHEDPRYKLSGSENPVYRVAHALAWTFFDQSDSGHRTLAARNFTSAGASGFVGMAYLPNGYNDTTHAEQRMIMQFSGQAIANVFSEFEPQWGPIMKKIHLPRLLPPWWVPEHRQKP